MKVVFSTAAYAALLAETQEKIKTETGGVFLGSFQNDTWYIIETIDPGPNSVFRIDYFEYDQPYTTHLINKRARLYKSRLTLIGLWHRHPGSFDVFSMTDDGTNAKYAAIGPNGAVSMLVNIDPVFRLSVFHVGLRSPGKPDYTLISYEVCDEHIPPELLEKKSILDLQNSIDYVGIRALGLDSYLLHVTRQLEKVPDSDENAQDSNIIYLNGSAGANPEESDEQAEKDKLIDLVIDHLDYLSARIKFNISAVWKDQELQICENRNGEKVPVFSFVYLPACKCAGLVFHDQRYFCKPDMFCSENIPIEPSGTMRRTMNRGGETSTVPSSPLASESMDIEQAYLSLRNGLNRFLQTLLDGKK